MNIVTTLDDWFNIRQQFTGTMGFVPTMGYLHEGHLSLCDRAKKEQGVCAVSIFVNKTQFNEIKDYENYTRSLDRDIALLKKINIDYVFVPTHDMLYPDRYEVRVDETVLSQLLEGVCRPFHFTGMLTVVLKLFNIIRPTHAYFGEKDFQQLLLIKKMVQAFFLPVTVVSGETIRAADGLAHSSRNSRLSPKARKIAMHFPRLLQSAKTLMEIEEELKALGFEVEYIEECWGRRLGAVKLENIRLIDNIMLNSLQHKSEINICSYV